MRASVSTILGAVLALASGAHAEPKAAALHIWYRTSDGCPEGAAFIDRLERKSVEAELAGVSDPVDFVVTLGPTKQGFSGRLERQTAQGTVAIRSFEASDCAEVADALALTLALSAAPSAPHDGAPPPPESVPADADARPTPETSLPKATTPTPTPTPTRTGRPEGSEPVVDRGLERGAQPGRPAWWLGAQAFGATGVAPGWMPGVGVFLQHDFRGTGPWVPAFRLTALAGRARDATSQGDLTTALFVGRFEGCPLVFETHSFSVRPCAGVDAGMLRADFAGPGGRVDSGSWFALVAHPRFDWMLPGGFSLDGQAGVSVPLARHDIVLADSEVLFRTPALGFQAGFGLAYRWP